MGFSRGPSIVTDGLVLALDAANTKSYPGSGTSLTDLSISGNTGTLEGGTTFSTGPSRFDTNATNQTTNNSLSLGTNIVFADTDEYTFSFMVKFRTSIQTTFQSLAGRMSTNPWLSLVPSATSFNMRYRQSGGTYHISSVVGYNIQANWANVVLTVDNSRTLSLYNNGEFVETFGSPTSTTFTINRLAGGYSSGGNYYALQGSFGPCYIYSKVLTAAEVLQNYNATKSRFGL